MIMDLTDNEWDLILQALDMVSDSAYDQGDKEAGNEFAILAEKVCRRIYKHNKEIGKQVEEWMLH